jgi:hypothetical protein
MNAEEAILRKFHRHFSVSFEQGYREYTTLLAELRALNTPEMFTQEHALRVEGTERIRADWVAVHRAEIANDQVGYNNRLAKYESDVKQQSKEATSTGNAAIDAFNQRGP